MWQISDLPERPAADSHVQRSRGYGRSEICPTGGIVVAARIWAIKLDRKKTGEDKDGEKIAYVSKRGDRGEFVYKDTSLKARPWQPQDCTLGNFGGHYE